MVRKSQSSRLRHKLPTIDNASMFRELWPCVDDQSRTEGYEPMLETGHLKETPSRFHLVSDYRHAAHLGKPTVEMFYWYCRFSVDTCHVSDLLRGVSSFLRRRQAYTYY
ncbi:unnamed protein product, partial [Ixodes pacificus]